MRTDLPRIKSLPVCVGFAAAAVLSATVAIAQEPLDGTTSAQSGPPEQVTITRPNYPSGYSPWQASISAPYRRHTMSIPVSYSDLNLHTGEGVYTLRQRVKYTARDICNSLTFRSPVGLPDADGCYRHAVEDAMPRTDSALWNYRSPGSM